MQKCWSNGHYRARGKIAAEAQLIEGLRIYPVSHLKEVCNIIQNLEQGFYLNNEARQNYDKQQKRHSSELDFNEVKGQHTVKRALENCGGWQT